MRQIILAALVVLLTVQAPAQTPTGDEILKKIDENLYIDQAMSTSTMIIHGRSGTRTITSRSWNSIRE